MKRIVFLSALTGLLISSVACSQTNGDPAQNQPVTPTADTTHQETEVQVDTVATAAGNAFTIERTSNIDKRFEPVIKQLIKEGWPQQWLEGLFGDKRTVFIPKMALIKPRSGKSADNSAYAWVNTRESADACEEFINKYQALMQQAEERYGVDRETIAALMRCETRHGSVTGDYHVFSVYASMALMDDQPFLQQSFDNAREVMKGRNASNAKIDSEIDWIRSRAATRSKWAYRELVNLLKIERAGYTEALGIYGSWAGAFGWSQFLPSSYLLRAVDGDGDRKIDLFTPADAIHSVANYLSKAGYKMGNDASRRKALRSYNNSTPYVESIVALADRVKLELNNK